MSDKAFSQRVGTQMGVIFSPRLATGRCHAIFIRTANEKRFLTDAKNILKTHNKGA